jgi:predicted phosphodiesterase
MLITFAIRLKRKLMINKVEKNTGKILYVGDLHIRVKNLKTIISEAMAMDEKPDAIIQVGDFGVMWPKYTENMDAYLHERASNGYDIPIITCGGNHDNWDLFYKLASETTDDLIELVPGSGVYYARRGSVIDIAGISHGFMGGAWSSNGQSITEGIEYWPNKEEPTYGEMSAFFDKVLELKPDTIVTHEAPRLINFERRGRNSNKTVRMLDDMFWNLISEGYQPRFHMYGHHHVLRKDKISGTRFYCCGFHGQGWVRETGYGGNIFSKL